jgi:hypothetical protein
MGLVLIEAPLIGSILVRLVSILFAYLYIGNLMEALESEEVIRRGSTYTLQDSPSSFYIQVALYSVISFLGCWYATFGTKVKRGN